MALLKDLFDIPDRVQKGDFVLRLAEDINRPEVVLDNRLNEAQGGGARAISAYFVDIQERLGGGDDPRLAPLVASIIELLLWLKQWHAGLDPDYNQRMDEVFEGLVTEEAKNLGLTIEEIKAWQPPTKAARRNRQ